MSAMIAALLLDREARSMVLDADPSHGSLQEPFLKFVRILRSMEFKASDDVPLIRVAGELQDRIGQAPYGLPSVFSFFLPEYQNSGKYKDRSKEILRKSF